MTPTFRSVETLLACRLLTRDGTEAGLTDLILDTEDWRVQFLIADARQWAVDADAVLTPRLVANIDENRARIVLDLSAADLQASPLLAVGEGLAGFDEAGTTTPPHWREHWRARMQPESGADAPPPPAGDDEVAADLGVETDLSVEQLIRADTLRGMTAETVDGSLLRIRDLLIDDSDWSLAYLDLLRADRPGSRGGQGEALRCLLGRNGIDWLNRRAQTLHLAVWMQELRKAPAGRLPVAGGADTPVRILTPEA